MKLGSLFDGSGGFPLAGALNGITPVWAAEIEPYPIAVTRSRFPHMKHLGSVTEINGAEIEPVDVITFGSPCQDLSVAGRRAGIHDGARSSMFFEAIRIIREMRNNGSESGECVRHPRFAVWENVPGAFSSNGGDDFRCVLEALAECAAGGEVHVPRSADGRWCPAGEIVADKWSLAWRTLDAQYWGVPQRRKRIYLVADFGGKRAGEILFKPDGVPGHHQPSQTQGQGAAEDAEGCAGGGCAAGFVGGQGAKAGNIGYEDGLSPTLRGGLTSDVVCLNDQGGNVMSVSEGVTSTLRAQAHQHEPTACYAIDSLSSNSMKSSNPNSGFHREEISKTLHCAGDTHGDISLTLTQECAKHPGVTVCYDTTQITSPQNASNPHPGSPCHSIAAAAHVPLAVCYSQGGFGQYIDDKPLIRASGGDLGGGSEGIVIERDNTMQNQPLSDWEIHT